MSQWEIWLAVLLERKKEEEKKKRKEKKNHPRVSSQRQMRQTCLPSLIGMV